MRYTFNINAQAIRDIGRLRDVMSKIKPTSAFVMDGIGLALDLRQYLSGDKIMIHRFYSPQEGDYWQLTSPAQAFNEIWNGGANQYADRLYFSVNNEPSHGNPGKGLKELLDWNIELMDIAHSKGVRLGIGEFAVGKTIEKSDVDNGVWDNFLRALDRHRNFHILTVHEYTAITLPYTFLGLGGKSATQAENMAVSQWSRKPLELARKPDGQLPDWWHLMRVGWLLIRADEIGVSRPKFIITEGLWDNMDDLNRHDNELGMGTLDWYKKRFNTDVRGIQSYPDIWRWMYPELAFDEATAYQLAWADQIVYPEECVGICLFAWNFYWEQQLHDYSHPEMYGIHYQLERYASGAFDGMFYEGSAQRPEEGVLATVWSTGASDVPVYSDVTYSKIVGHISAVGAEYRYIPNIVSNKVPLLTKDGKFFGYVARDQVYIEGWLEPTPYVDDYVNNWRKAYIASSWGGNSNVRIRPTINSGIAGKLLPSEYQMVYMRTLDGQYVDRDGNLWYQIQYNHDGRKFLGWVRSDVFVILDNRDTVTFEFELTIGEDDDLIKVFESLKAWFDNR